MRILARIKRRDQGLNQTHRAVIGAAIAPRLEIVRLVDVPVTKLRGLVLVEAEVNTQGNVGILQRVGKAEIYGRVVNRVAAENDEQIHLPGAHRWREVEIGR